MSPFFSIVIPSFNRSSYVRNAIDIIFSQTYGDFEIILVDDGSTDDTECVVKEFSDPRLRYFKKLNEERSIARNFGIERAKGLYINFLDSDDKFYPHHLKTAHDFICSKNFPEVCHLGYEKVTAEGDIIFQRNDFDDRLRDKLINENILHCNAIFIRREIAVQFPFIQSKDAFISEDWYVWLRLASRFKIHTNNVVTSAIVEHGARSLNNIDVDKLITCTELIIKYLKKDEVFLLGYQRKVSPFFARQYTFVMLMLSLNKRRNDYVIYLIKALREDVGVVMSRRFIASLKYFFLPFLIDKKF